MARPTPNDVPQVGPQPTPHEWRSFAERFQQHTSGVAFATKGDLVSVASSSRPLSRQPSYRGSLAHSQAASRRTSATPASRRGSPFASRVTTPRSILKKPGSSSHHKRPSTVPMLPGLANLGHPNTSVPGSAYHTPVHNAARSRAPSVGFLLEDGLHYAQSPSPTHETGFAPDHTPVAFGDGSTTHTSAVASVVASRAVTPGSAATQLSRMPSVRLFDDQGEFVGVPTHPDHDTRDHEASDADTDGNAEPAGIEQQEETKGDDTDMMFAPPQSARYPLTVDPKPQELDPDFDRKHAMYVLPASSITVLPQQTGCVCPCLLCL